MNPPIERSQWLGLSLLLLPAAMVAVDANAVLLALPALTRDLGASAAAQLWVADVYALMVGVLVLVSGGLGDQLGRRRLLRAGAAAFLVASVIAAFAPNVWVLVSARAGQGIAGAAMMPSTLALISELFPDVQQRGRAIAAWATTSFASAAVGPVIGGLLLHYFWWGSVFLFPVPFCLAVVVLAPRWLPEHVDREHAVLVDAPSALLLVATFIGVYVAMKGVIPGSALPGWVLALAAVIALVCGVAFLRRQRGLDRPLLDVALLRQPAISAVVSALVLTGVVLAGTALWVSQVLQSVLSLSPVAAALAIAPMGLGIAAGTSAAPALAKRVPPRALAVSGMILSALGSLLLLAVSSERHVVLLVVSFTLTAAGCGPLFAFGTNAVISASPPHAAGRAAGLTETGNYLGSSLGVAVLGTLGATVYSATLEPSLQAVPSALRERALQNMAQGQTVAAEHAPNLLPHVAHAGMQGLHVVGVAAAALLLLCAAALRHLRSAEPAAAEPLQ